MTVDDVHWEGMVGRHVIVHWLDIVQKAGCEGHAMRPAKCQTWGRLEKVDADAILILTEQMDDDHTYQVFPRGCVTEIVSYPDFTATYEFTFPKVDDDGP